MSMTDVSDCTFLGLDDTYRSLSQFDGIRCSIKVTEIATTLENLEKIGFVGLEVHPFLQKDTQTEIRAYKGKHNPCYDTKVKVQYTGSAIAAVDDDMHLLFKNKHVAICEKTYQIYQLGSYHQNLRFETKNHNEHQSLLSKKISFNCNTLKTDVDELRKELPQNIQDEDDCNLFYPGPFKSLITSKGTILRRGQVNKVESSLKEALIQSDNCFVFEGNSVKKLNWHQLDNNEDIPSFLYEFDIDSTDSKKINLQLNSLPETLPSLKVKIEEIIHQNKDYMVLTGSDPKIKLGCCPSEEVGAANELLEAGVLEKVKQNLPSEVCPINIYAFRGEITKSGDSPVFIRNEDFRNEIMAALHKKTESNFTYIIRWTLLVFILISLFFAFDKYISKPQHSNTKDLYQNLGISKEDKNVILLFHYGKRCEQCINMESFTKELIENKYANNKLKFLMINMDLKKNEALLNDLDLFTSSLYFFRFKEQKIYQRYLHKKAWESYKDKTQFKSQLSVAIEKFFILPRK